MKIKPISPKVHAIIDYALAGSLLALPALLHMNRKVRLIYEVEAAILLPYVALTAIPTAVKDTVLTGLTIFLTDFDKYNKAVL